MDRTVPAGAALLLDFVHVIETGKTDRSSYDVIYRHNDDKNFEENQLNVH